MSFMNLKILLVDDDELFCLALKDGLPEFDITVAHTLQQAIQEMKRLCFDVLLVDNSLPDGNGMELINHCRKFNEKTKVIVITAYPSIKTAVQAVKNGAYDYLTKPIDLEELRTKIEHAQLAIEFENIQHLQDRKQNYEKAVLVGSSHIHRQLEKLASKAATCNVPVLITGETGTGKGLLASSIHQMSERRKKPFVQINCAALPEHLIEAELFGFERGAFTGANQTKYGLFELANRGTLFLDEICEMPLSLQSKLLSAIETCEIRRLGSNVIRKVDVRIIAATNIEPEKALKEKKLRSDLFYRLSVLHIHIPPLRLRKEDIPLLCQHFLRQLASGKNISIPPEEIKKLQDYNFPGNIRELRNLIERSLILQDGEKLFPSRFINSNSTSSTTSDGQPIFEPHFELYKIQNFSQNEILTLAEIERLYIEFALRKTDYNLAKTSKKLGISLSTLKRKIKLYGLQKPPNQKNDFRNLENLLQRFEPFSKIFIQNE